jgi:hypothetical protein
VQYQDGDDYDEDEDEDDYELTEEERMELEFDKKHLSMELVAAGDDVNRPLTGDVVRVRYTAYTLTTSGLYNAENLKVPLLILAVPSLSRSVSHFVRW